MQIETEGTAAMMRGDIGEGPAVGSQGLVDRRIATLSAAAVWRWAAALLVAAALTPTGASAQPAPSGGQVVIPGSSLAKPGDAGVRAHTNTLIFIPNRGTATSHPDRGSTQFVPPSKPRPPQNGAAAPQ